MPPTLFGLGGPAGLFARGVQRLFGLQRGPAQVSPEFQNSVDLFQRPEFWALHGGSLLMGDVLGVGAGGVGFRSQMALSMIPAARSIAILEKLWITTGTAETLIFGLSSTELTTSTGNLVARDTRRIVTSGGSVPAQCRLRTQNNAALANIATELGRLIPAANVINEVEMNLVLGPGWSLRIYIGADNTALNSFVTFFVRERPAIDEELLGL